MKILLTAFKDTSSEKLINCFDDRFFKLILQNNKLKSEHQLKQFIDKEKPNYVISLGQRPVIKNKIHIETCAKSEERIIYTDFDYDTLLRIFKDNGIEVKLSNNAGRSFCNNIYCFGLSYIQNKKIDTKMLFVHIPFEKNISDFKCFADKMINALEYIN